MDLDEILPSIGEFGRYQKLVLYFILLPAVFPCGFHAYNQLFMAAVPEHWCLVPELEHIDKNFARNLRYLYEILFFPLLPLPLLALSSLYDYFEKIAI